MPRRSSRLHTKNHSTAGSGVDEAGILAVKVNIATPPDSPDRSRKPQDDIKSPKSTHVGHKDTCTSPSTLNTKNNASPQAKSERRTRAEDILSKSTYRPSPRWLWTLNRSLHPGEILLKLGGMSCLSRLPTLLTKCIGTDHHTINLMRGSIGSRSFCYIAKTWFNSKGLHESFYSELALYKTKLRPLQGSIVLNVIGVFSQPEGITMAFEPPHGVFWAEASQDLPLIMKRHCIEAADELHKLGVLHGNLNLSNIWIGADMSITIVNFDTSRSVDPDEDVYLKTTTVQDILVEKRKLKLQLGIEKAWKEEKQILLGRAPPPATSPVPPTREWFKQPPDPRIYSMSGLAANHLASALDKFRIKLRIWGMDPSSSYPPFPEQLQSLHKGKQKADNATNSKSDNIPISSNSSVQTRRDGNTIPEPVRQSKPTGTSAVPRDSGSQPSSSKQPPAAKEILIKRSPSPLPFQLRDFANDEPSSGAGGALEIAPASPGMMNSRSLLEGTKHAQEDAITRYSNQRAKRRRPEESDSIGSDVDRKFKRPRISEQASSTGCASCGLPPRGGITPSPLGLMLRLPGHASPLIRRPENNLNSDHPTTRLSRRLLSLQRSSKSRTDSPFVRESLRVVGRTSAGDYILQAPPGWRKDSPVIACDFNETTKPTESPGFLRQVASWFRIR